MTWYVSRDGNQEGPYSPEELKVIVENNVLLASDMVWKPGMDEWRRAEDVPGLLRPPPSVGGPTPLGPELERAAPKYAKPAIKPSAPAIHDSKKTSSWDWIWSTIMAVIIFRLIGIVGGLVTIGVYYWIKPKLGIWGAVAASAVLGTLAGIGLAAAIRA